MRNSKVACKKIGPSFINYPGNIYQPKVNNRSTRKRCEIPSTLAIKTPEQARTSNNYIKIFYLRRRLRRRQQVMWKFGVLCFLFTSVLRFAFLPAGIYLFKVNNRNTRTRCEITFKVNNKDTRTKPTLNIFISHLVLVFLLLTLNM